ncbi:ExeA family protein [Shewanella sp. NIFS-20-20]|uniref:ExeA family protein n=1 Tax=Shewanella sp. NIFS-20-20 TaxID=2853806 RepID=UPI001C453F3A|nr:ExeA family protein [Shewanella sp. NIFS-20-20]MBV7314274.1 AAA family ATPase [Shewanella sp. NIFS-20-20]
MYKAFFGLTDTPFSIAPNPAYLFLSERHSEALVHLTYGLGDSGGFVLLTGEVGTGKTTVSRCLLGQLPDNTDTAFILNPALTELELLATICDELHIGYQAQPSLKQLTDLISQFLLNNHKQGRNTVLIIDEAQHLRASVLEQLRLLTNLETDTKKLLQVVLIGQPELQQLLKRQELRQLAQRITARYHLMPLDQQEVARYVQHRLEVAGRFQPLFTPKALAKLHQLSGGIPRLINLICDRAMMAAYAAGRAQIDQDLVAKAALEVSGDAPEVTATRPWLGWSLVTLVSAFLVFLALTKFMPAATVSPANDTEIAHELMAQEDPVLRADPQVNQAVIGQQQWQQALVQATEAHAFAALLGQWGKHPMIGMSPCQAALEQGLQCKQLQGNFHTLAQFDYPAVVHMLDDNNQLFYATLIAVEQNQLLLQLGEQQFWVSRDWFDSHFGGSFELLVNQPSVSLDAIGPGVAGARVQWLENALARVQGRALRSVIQFDDPLTRDLTRFQQQQGLQADGIAGRDTLGRIDMLLNATGPRLHMGAQ